MVFANAAMASRSNLEREMLSWIDREGVIPPGNGPEKDLWEVSHLGGSFRQFFFLSFSDTNCCHHFVLHVLLPFIFAHFLL